MRKVVVIRESSVPHCSKHQAEEGNLDIQLKRGLLDVCVLAAIRNEESYGYKIIKDVMPYVRLSESTLYTILKRLELLDMLTVRTSLHNGRVRKYYSITEKGKKRLSEFKSEWSEVMSIYQYVVKEVSRGD